MGRKNPGAKKSDAPDKTPLEMRVVKCWNCGREDRIPKNEPKNRCPACEMDPK